MISICWGMVYFDQHGGWFSQEVYTPFHSQAEVAFYQPVVDGPNIRNGMLWFGKVCSVCHGSDGAGKPNQAPPLAGSEWVMGPIDRLIRIPIFGLQAPITVKQQKMSFPSGMPPIAASLADEDLANLLSYIRQAWGNKASSITPAEIRAVRTLVANHPQAFTPEEILQVPEK